MIDHYKKALGPMLDIYEKKAIYHSELATFCQQVREHQCTNIYESGTYLGFTAIRLAKVFPEIQIFTYEKDRDRFKEARKRCKPYENIYCIHGELKHELYKIGKDSAVLIDGPKGEQAIKLAKKCRKNASMVAIHDMKDFLDVIKKRFEFFVHTGHPTEEFKELDKAIPYKPSHHQNGMWGNVLVIVP